MKTFIMSVVVSLLLMAGFSNVSFAQRYRDDRARVRTSVTFGSPNVRVHYSNYPHHYYYHDYPYYHRVYYNPYPYHGYHRVYYREARYWVPGHYNSWGDWVPGYWR